MIDRALERCAAIVVHHPRAVIATFVVVTLLAGVALLFFRLEPDLEKSLPADHHGVELRRLIESEADTQRTLLIALEGEEIDALVERAVKELEASPYLERITATKEDFVGAWVDEFRASPLASVSAEGLDRLARRLTTERRATIESLPDRIAEDPFVGLELARRDPLGVRWLFEEASRETLPLGLNKDSPYLVLAKGNIAFVRAHGREKPFDMNFTKRLMVDVESRLDSLRPELLDYRLIGSYPSARLDASRITDDLFRSCFWAMTMIFIFLTISTRRLLDPPILLFPTAFVLLWTMAFGGWWFGPLTPLATSAAPVLSGLSVDLAIHYLGRYRRERAGGSAAEATFRTTRHLGPPLLAGVLTSIAAFASLLFTRFGGFRSFSALLALGLICAYVLTLFLLPLLLRKTRPRPLEKKPGSSSTGAVLTLAHRVVESRAGVVLMAAMFGLALAGWIGVATVGVPFDADPRVLRPVDDPIAASAEWLESSLGFSPIPVTLLVPATTPIAACAEHLASLERSGAIQFSLGAHRTVATGAQRDRVEAFRAKIAGWREAADEDFARAELEPGAFATGLDELARGLTEDRAPNRALTQLSWRGKEFWKLTVFTARTLWLTEDRAAFRAAVETRFESDGPRVEIVAPFGLADDLTDLLTEDLLRSAGIALVAVVLLTMVFVGRTRFAVLSLLPVATALGITLGAMALFGYPIHLGNLVAVPFLIGLGIDDGIHMVARHREGVTTRELLGSSGRSVWRTSVTTLLGFGSLAFASSPGLASLGWVMTIGIAACFVTSIVTIPVLARMSGFRIDPK